MGKTKTEVKDTQGITIPAVPMATINRIKSTHIPMTSFALMAIEEKLARDLKK